jgi:hypothetical protein
MTKQEKDGILSTVLNIPTPLKHVKLAPKNKLEKLLIYLKLKRPVYEMLYISGLKMSTNFRLTAITNSLQAESHEEGEQSQLMDLLHANTYQMAGYIATAIHNKNVETPRYLIQTIADEFTNEELKLASQEVYRRLDVQSFFGSMELIRNLSLM